MFYNVLLHDEQNLYRREDISKSILKYAMQEYLLREPTSIGHKYRGMRN